MELIFTMFYLEVKIVDCQVVPILYTDFFYYIIIWYPIQVPG